MCWDKSNENYKNYKNKNYAMVQFKIYLRHIRNKNSNKKKSYIPIQL